MPPRKSPVPTRWTESPDLVRPMLATPYDGEITEAMLTSERLVYEPKWDGMRVLVSIEPGKPSAAVSLRSRLGHEKSDQFPDVVRELKAFARHLRQPVILDGELVALDSRGEPVGFQALAGRIHVKDLHEIDLKAGGQPVALFVFDVLRDGGDDLRGLPLVERKMRLERVFANEASARVRPTDMAAGDGRRMYARAQTLGWEGLIAKEAHSTYESGRRSPAWRKLKLHKQDEFVVGGWTDPRETRPHFGALILGIPDRPGKASPLRFAGLVGTGFKEADLAAIAKMLDKRATAKAPFRPHPNLPAKGHWVRPDLVAAVRYTEWTREHMLRHPVFLGLRDDKRSDEVAEPGAGEEAPTVIGSGPHAEALDAVITQLRTLETTRKDGTLTLPDGERLDVTNLAKVFWPATGITKGELLRYYTGVSSWLLAIVHDRPLVMKRFPNGVTGKAFYQQRAPDDPPPGVRIEAVEGDDDNTPRLIGGSLKTLLYVTQLAAISQDPWFSRAESPHLADFAAIDLDPMPGVPFTQVIEVAQAVAEELDAIGVAASVKTSGSSGMHVYIALEPDTPYEAGQLFCQIVATIVASKHPAIATVERTVGKRGRTVYVDYLQNIEGKTLASAYSVRANEFAGVSTPLHWKEVTGDLRPDDFTIRTVMARFADVGDLWAPITNGPGIDLHAALEKLARRVGA